MAQRVQVVDDTYLGSIVAILHICLNIYLLAIDDVLVYVYFNTIFIALPISQ
jgi:hypothetical protein